MNFLHYFLLGVFYSYLFFLVYVLLLLVFEHLYFQKLSMENALSFKS